MPWKMHRGEFENVRSLPPEKRYEYALGRIADWQEVWGLQKGDEWAYASDGAGHFVLPIWPHPELAAACATGDWAGDAPASIALSIWFTNWLPGLQKDGRLVGVFPTGSGSYVIVEPSRLEADLREACESYGGI